MVERELVRDLCDRITDEVLVSIGVAPSGWLGRLIAIAIRPATRRFAALFAAFDRDVADLGFSTGARRFLPRYISACSQHGAASIPTSGPLLVASNHPGATDSVVIAAALPRDDLKIVISDVPFTRALPAGRAHLIYAPTGTEGRVQAVRDMIRHLQDGGAVLIFPGGYLDPDPALLPGASEGLGAWSRSVLIALRRVPEAQLVPAIVDGVMAPRFLFHPLTRLAPAGWQRLKLAEVLQIATQSLFGARSGLTPRVTFGPPVSYAALAGPDAARDPMAAMVDHARATLALHERAADLAMPIPLPPRRG
ncbi:MAG: hypothetical protein JXA09_08125 [Anaerolineae bacterium]|nr:hypothetical protein [Anaerolineae bacterium]